MNSCIKGRKIKRLCFLIVEIRRCKMFLWILNAPHLIDPTWVDCFVVLLKTLFNMFKQFWEERIEAWLNTFAKLTMNRCFYGFLCIFWIYGNRYMANRVRRHLCLFQRRLEQICGCPALWCRNICTIVWASAIDLTHSVRNPLSWHTVWNALRTRLW